MDKVIQSDLYRYGALTGFKGFLNGMIIPGFRYMYFWRKAAKHPKGSIPGIFFRLIVRHYGYKFGFQIPVATQIGEGFYIGHYGTVVVNPLAKIGRNCNIAHGVTIGQANRGKLQGCPIIGDKVWIGTGAVLVGSIVIGSNVLIAPNSYVNIDIPDNSIVMGNPSKIIPNENATDGYIEFILGED
jgi:serine O-acetyltransferase